MKLHLRFQADTSAGSPEICPERFNCMTRSLGNMFPRKHPGAAQQLFTFSPEPAVNMCWCCHFPMREKHKIPTNPDTGNVTAHCPVTWQPSPALPQHCLAVYSPKPKQPELANFPSPALRMSKNHWLQLLPKGFDRYPSYLTNAFWKHCKIHTIIKTVPKIF